LESPADLGKLLLPHPGTCLNKTYDLLFGDVLSLQAIKVSEVNIIQMNDFIFYLRLL
jgi:hypothetical protein